MKPKPPESMFRPGQVLVYPGWNKSARRYVVERFVQGMYVLRHQSGAVAKQSRDWVEGHYKLDAKSSEEYAVTKILKKYYETP